MVLRSTSSGTRARIASGLLQSLAGLRTERIRAGQPVAIAEQGHEIRPARRRRACTQRSSPRFLLGRSR